MCEADEVNAYVDGIWKDCIANIRKLCEIRAGEYPEQAEEICNEVYIEFSKAVKAGREITHPKAWIYKTANNIITRKYKDFVKQNKVLMNFDENERLLNNLSINIDFDDVIISDETIDLLADDITENLSDEEKIILKLYYEKNLSMKDIAVHLQKSESAVKQKHFRLCRKIKKLAKEKIENL